MLYALKNYQVKPEDFDDNGELRPDAELMPEFAKLYDYIPGNGTATYSSEDKYDDSTNVHKGRHFNIYNKNTGERILDNSRVKHRGHSAIGWVRGRDRWNNVFDDWSHKDRRISIDEYNKRRKKFEDNEPGTKYQLNSVNHWDYDSIDEKTINNIDDELVSNTFKGNISFGPDSLIVARPDGRITDTINTIHLPFLVGIDNEDDVVSLADILEHDYDPGRDYAHELQLKNIRTKTLPSGLVVPAGESDISYNNKKLEEDIDDISFFIYDVINFVEDGSRILHDIDSKSDFNDNDVHTAATDISGCYDEIDDKFSDFRYIFESNDLLREMLNKYVNARIMDALNAAGDLDEFMDLCYGGSDYYPENFINAAKYYLDYTAFSNLMDNMKPLCNSEFLSDMNELYKGIDSCMFEYKSVITDSNGRKLKILRPNWDEFLNTNFSRDDEHNISDRHLKTVIGDLCNDIKSKREAQNIVRGIKRWGY